MKSYQIMGLMATDRGGSPL